MISFLRSLRLPGLLAFLVALALAPASAQDAYPARAIRLIVPFPAGGPTDVFARHYAEALATKLGGAVVVENKAGAAGAIGTLEASRASPDGYTLLFGTASTHALYPLMKAAPQYDPVKDFAHIAIVGAAPAAFAVHPAMPADLAALIALAKSKPGDVKYGSPGTGTFLHLAAERLKLESGGADMVHVSYRGSAPAMNDLLGGHIGMVSDTLGTSLSHHKEGRIKILAVAARSRSPLAPDVPTVDEAIGSKGFVAELWNIVCAPAGTPASVVDAISKATTVVMADPALRQKLQVVGIEANQDSTPALARDYVIAEQARWRPVVAAAGVKPE
ncbi:MAG: tripartite tricarboxylate transporter substrate binding protein [Hyphomicrobiales bacterium]|nr:MAG: tripartite tricarboxylate transporter substrate binding protein [Hyphomicrobiales bacterium]